ncbi:hypothetical protein HPB47_005364 [Ixodes persulcatus]|uniref:Uncharacterized protein n=1 Tax=Ixodes persulcatus TaxID=34615 RepID=A0AC60PE15_IXOPE|nr:hypothetical protein HPB47_005364 [Ixodes persulcatus]
MSADTGITSASTGSCTADPGQGRRFRRSAAKIVIDLHIPNGHLQQQNRELQVCWAGAQARGVFQAPGRAAEARGTGDKELATPEPPKLFLMPLSNMEQFLCCRSAAEALHQQDTAGDSKNLQKVVREMVGRLFSRQVQEQFSLLGYRGKSRFKDAIMCKVVIDVVLNVLEVASTTSFSTSSSRILDLEDDVQNNL